MYPTLITIGSFAVTSFGAFMLLAFLSALFMVWRLARVYDFDKERILDLFVLTTVVSLIGARSLFVLEHLANFQNIAQVFSLNRYPGLNFWGGFIFGAITILIAVKRLKIQFWQAADIAIVGLMVGLSIGSLGCLLGSCQYGYPSTSFIAVTQIGLVGKRFPIQILASLIYLVLTWYFWRGSLKFHFVGKIATAGLVILALTIFILNFFRADAPPIYQSLKLAQLIALGMAVLGLLSYLKLSRRSVWKDLKVLAAVTSQRPARQTALLLLRRKWYNLTVDTKLALKSLLKDLTRKINVKPTPKKF